MKKNKSSQKLIKKCRQTEAQHIQLHISIHMRKLEDCVLLLLCVMCTMLYVGLLPNAERQFFFFYSWTFIIFRGSHSKSIGFARIKHAIMCIKILSSICDDLEIILRVRIRNCTIRFRFKVVVLNKQIKRTKTRKKSYIFPFVVFFSFRIGNVDLLLPLFRCSNRL